MHIANWSDREIETAIEETFTKLGYPAANPEQLEAVEEFVKGLRFYAVWQWKVLCYDSLPLVLDYLHRGSTPMSIAVAVSPLKALMLDQVTCKHLLHTWPGISCILVCPTLLHKWSKAAVALERSVGSCNR